MKQFLTTGLKTLLIALFVLISSNVLAGKVKIFDGNDLSCSLPYCLAQDKYGYIWVGTTHGLNRYDGYEFLKYHYDKDNESTISNNDISSMLCDNQGRLWIGTNKGLCRYDYKTNSFVRYNVPDATPRVSSIYERTNGDLLVGTTGHGLFVLKKDAEELQKVVCPKKLSYDLFIERIYEDGKGNVWWSTHQNTITRCALKGNKIDKAKEYTLECGKVSSFIKLDNSGFLIACTRGILSYNYAADKISDAGYDLTALPFGTEIITAHVNSKGSIGIGTSNKGFFYIPMGTRTMLQPEFKEGFDISNSEINALLSDADGNSWISCYHKGVVMASLSDDVFHVAGTIIETEKQLDSRRSSISTVDIVSLRSQLGSGSINIAVENNGEYFVSDYGNGMLIFNPSTGEKTRMSMYQKQRKGGYLTNDWINTLFIDSRLMLWIGTANGTSCMDLSDRTFNKYGWNEIMSGIKCTAIGETQEGDILLGTDQGLYIYNRKENKVGEAKNSKELQTRIIYGFQTDKEGDVWISTSMGLWRWDVKKDEFIGLLNGSGLRSKEYLPNSSFCFADGSLDFGTNDGIVVFNPNDVKHNIIDLGKVRLSSIAINNEVVGCTQDEYKIHHDERLVTLHYSMFDFRGNEDVTFQYQINNSGEWTSVPEGSNTITFNGMEPGTYHIEVRACCNGVYSSENCITTLKVLPPWYLSIWASVLYLLLLVGIIVFVVRHIESKRKADYDEQKMQFLINATHDIRSPLTLILGPLKKLKEKITDPDCQNDIETIDHNAHRLLTLVNQILDERKIDKNQMHLHCQETDMVSFVKNICHLYDFNADERGIKFTFSSSADKIMAWIDHTNFDKILNNIISNAFKYTFDGGEINVSMRTEDVVGRQGRLVIDVIDNGFGLQEDDPEKLFVRFYQGKNSNEYKIEGTGIGLNLSQSLVKMHGGKITATSRPDGERGSVFSIAIPLGNEHLKEEEIITTPQPSSTNPHSSTSKPQANRNLRILVVDDDPAISDFISDELSTWYRFSSAKNGREALSRLLSEPFDLVISDVMMPVMDGIEMLKNVKSNSNISHIPVVLLTSKSAVDYRLEGLKKGADAYLSKPFDMEELHILIDNLVDNRRRLRGKFSGAQQAEGKVEEVSVKGNDEALMEQIMECINKHLTDPNFNVEQLSRELCISRAQLFRRMKEITGISTSEFIRNLRLEQAARLLREGKINVSQVAYSVGFNSQTHFSTLFKKHYGKSPSEYAANVEE